MIHFHHACVVELCAMEDFHVAILNVATGVGIQCGIVLKIAPTKWLHLVNGVVDSIFFVNDA
jgi:hypothetical protein